LAIVSRVAHQHGGEFIRLDRPEGGAIARLRLPAGSDVVAVV
jgi:signal transduction histidine kinase